MARQSLHVSKLASCSKIASACCSLHAVCLAVSSASPYTMSTLGQLRLCRYTKPEPMIRMMTKIKQVFDPNGIMNPYKMLPS